MEAIFGISERLHGGFHTRDIAVMIGTPDIDQKVIATTPLVAAFQFVTMVGDVGGKIGKLIVLFFNHAVLVIAEHAGLEPERSVALFEEPFVFERFYSLF